MGEGRYKNKDSAEPEGERKNDRKDIYIIAHNQGRGDTGIKTVQSLRERGRTTEKIYVIAHNQWGRGDTRIKTV